MNSEQLEVLDNLYSKLNINLVDMKELLHWILKHKSDNQRDNTFIMFNFCLSYADVVFVREHLEEIIDEHICRKCNDYTDCEERKECRQ